MEKILAILNWKGKMGYIILFAIILGLFSAMGSRISLVPKSAFETEQKSLEENKNMLESITAVVQSNNPLIEEFKKSKEYLSGINK